MRRVASQVHQQASRLIEAGHLKPPLWYNAVMDHPPLPLPPRASPKRGPFDILIKGSSHSSTAKHIPSKHLRPPKFRPNPIIYLEDKVRRQFFRDRPFQAFRAVSIVEGGAIEEEHAIRKTEWVRLAQHGPNPTPEDAVRFTVHLHTVHKKPLSAAYCEAVSQYDALRSELSIMTQFAALEAEAHGAVFMPGEIERGFRKEEAFLTTWEEKKLSDQAMSMIRKRWRLVVEKRDPGQWTRGLAYIRMWKGGRIPDYTSVSSSPVEIALASPQQETNSNPAWQGSRRI